MNDIGPRYDSKPTQPKDPGEMTREEETELFNETLARPEVAKMVWDAVIDEIDHQQAMEIVGVLFRIGRVPTSDFNETGRLIHKACCKRVHQLVQSEEHNTDMSKD